MVNKIQTLKNLNKKFPRFQLETLLSIIDCIEDEINIFPVTQNSTEEPIKPFFEPPYNPTCSNRITSTTDDYNPNCTLTAKENTPQEYYTYYKCTETTNDNGEEETNEVVATDDNGKIKVYLNGKECGVEFPAKSKKCPHLCDKTSCNVNIITNEEDDEDEEYDNDNMNKYDELFEKITKLSY